MDEKLVSLKRDYLRLAKAKLAEDASNQEIDAKMARYAHIEDAIAGTPARGRRGLDVKLWLLAEQIDPRGVPLPAFHSLKRDVLRMVKR